MIHLKGHLSAGQALPWVMLIMALILALVFSNIDRMHLAALKIKQQRETDAIAMKLGTSYSRSLNALGGINQGIDQMAIQFIFYTASAVATLAILIFSGAGLAYLLDAGHEFGIGLKKLLGGLKDIGEDFDSKIQKIEAQIFPNLCSTLKQEQWVALKDFIEDHNQLIMAQLQDTSIDSLDDLPTGAVSRLVSLIKHPLVYSYPDVCNPEVQQQWHALTRVESQDSFVECKSMTFESYQDYRGYQKIGWTQGSLVSGSVLYQEVLEQDIQGVSQPFEFVEHYGQANTSHVPQLIFRDPQGKESQTANTSFEFINGHFEVCMSAKNIWRSLGNTFSPFPIPDYVQLDDSFSHKNKIMVAMVQPFISIKPFEKARDLAHISYDVNTPWNGINDVIHTYQEYQQTMAFIASTIDSLLSQAQTVTTYAQIDITGPDGISHLNGMHFWPSLMDTTLEPIMNQRLESEFQ